MSVKGKVAIRPWTFKGIFASAAMALAEIAVALQRIAKALEDGPERPEPDELMGKRRRAA